MSVNPVIYKQWHQNITVNTVTHPQLVDFNQKVPLPQPLRGWQWQQHAIRRVTAWEGRLEEKIPCFLFQKKIDQLGQEIEKTFAPLTRFNKWLNTNEQGSWYKQLAWFLAKLPIKAARNIIQQLYQIIRSIINGLIHPLQTMNSIAKLLVMLPYELIQPEMFSKLGAGIIGTGLSEATLSAGLPSLIAIGVGGALLVGGVSAGTLKAALQAEKGQKLQATKAYLLKQAQELPETLLTSFYMGLIIGGIRRAVQELQAQQVSKQVKQKPELRSLERESTQKAPDFYQVVELCRKNPDEYPPIAYAVKIGRHDVAKFLIDHNESVNASTPSIPIWTEVNPTSDYGYWKITASQPGFTPLELAIQKNDLEMIRILTSYHATNRAAVTTAISRFQFTSPPAPDGFYWGDRQYFPLVTTTPLTQALATGNREIIETIIKSYTTPETLFETVGQIRAVQQESLMRVWLEQYAFLQNGTQIQVADETVQLFLSKSLQEALTANSPTDVLKLLESGWFVSKQELLQIFSTNNPDITRAVMTVGRIQPGINPMLVAVEAGSVEMLKSYVQQGVAHEGILLSAVQQNKKAIVEYLLELPIGQNELLEASKKAYDMRSYEILELLENKRLEVYTVTTI